MEAGVGLVTIHPTPTLELYRLSQQRMIPFTSRGGGLVIKDIIRSGRKKGNVYIDILEHIVIAAKRTNTVISIGASFRPGCIYDSMDEVHISEIRQQLKIYNKLKDMGVGVIIEGPGHCRPRDIIKYTKLIRRSNAPIMTLGPMAIDSAVGQDHITGTIGATLLGLKGCANILATVTREEHTGGIPSLRSLIEAIKAYKVVCSIIDLEVLSDDIKEREKLTWASTIACSQFAGLGGGTGVMTLHGIEHPLSGEYDVAHGDGLATLLIEWMKHTYPDRKERFELLGKNVFGEPDGISATEKWLKSVGMGHRLGHLGAKEADFGKLAENAIRTAPWVKFHPKPLDKESITSIYKKSL